MYVRWRTDAAGAYEEYECLQTSREIWIRDGTLFTQGGIAWKKKINPYFAVSPLEIFSGGLYLIWHGAIVMKNPGIASVSMIIILTITLSGYAFTFGITGNESPENGKFLKPASTLIYLGDTAGVSIGISVETLKFERQWGGSLKNPSHMHPANSFSEKDISTRYLTPVLDTRALSLS